MVIRCKHLCRHVLENQHKLQKFLQQQIRLCSRESVRAQPQFEEPTYDIQPRIQKSDNAQYVLHSADTGTESLQIEHSPNVGNLFRASDLRVRLAAPTQLQPKPEVDDLVFGKFFTDHMLKILWHRSLGGWQKPEITPMENLVIHPAAKVLHYAVELFEGMKAYRGEDGRIRVFRPNMNMQRMNITAFRTGLPTFQASDLIQCMNRLISIDQEWVPHTYGASLYIRPTLIGIDPTLGVAASDSALLYAILCPVGDYFKADTDGAISLLADPRYTRAWPGGVGDRKMGSNYAPTIHVQREAASKGLQQVLWLYGEDHQLTEVGTMNIFMFRVNEKGEKELVTPPLDGLILPGITRDSILRLARQWNAFSVKEEKFTMTEILQLVKEERLLELFGCGTACVVSPVNRIQYMGEDIMIPTMKQHNPIFQQLKTELTDIQYGRKSHPWAVVID